MPGIRRRLITTGWRLHRWLYRATGGRLGGRVVGMPVLLLTTRGRRTGRPHTTSLTYLRHGGSVVVIGSNGGAARHPDWILNLRAAPHATVQVRKRRMSVRAREAAGGERDHLWTRAARAYRGYAVYQARTSRTIPVVILDPEPD